MYGQRQDFFFKRNKTLGGRLLVARRGVSRGDYTALFVKRRSVGGCLTERARSMVRSTSAALVPDFCRSAAKVPRECRPKRRPLTPLLLTISSRLPHGWAFDPAKGKLLLSPGEPSEIGEFGAGRRLLLWAPRDAERPARTPKALPLLARPFASAAYCARQYRWLQ